jgi:hypothetical protein
LDWKGGHAIQKTLIAFTISLDYLYIVTLCAYENEGDLLHVPVLRHLCVVVVDGVEARLVLEAEDKDDRVHP